MKFALVNGERKEAQPNINGRCPCCNCPVIAKCGKVRIPHWAHRGMCDSWWEGETDWHRLWKGHFPMEWQEVIHKAENNETHIADVKTDQGYVIEFQHSHLDDQERISRESFYQNMLWVVDGTRLKRDFPRFLDGMKNFKSIGKPGIFLINFPDECFPGAWLESSVEVIFDFQGNSIIDPLDVVRNTLWCLLPGRGNTRYAVVIGISRQDFITTIMKQHRLLQDPAREIINALDKWLIESEIRKSKNKTREIAKNRRAIIPSRFR